MKKIFSAGSVGGLGLVLLGIVSIFRFDAALGVTAVFVGRFLLFGSIQNPPKISWETVDHEPHEPLRLARLFLGLSHTARIHGILSLVKMIEATSYPNPIFQQGLYMVIDGIDPDYVGKVLDAKQKTKFAHYLLAKAACQEWGGLFRLAALFGSVLSLLCGGCLYLMGGTIGREAVLALVLLTAIGFMGDIILRENLTQQIGRASCRERE